MKIQYMIKAIGIVVCLIGAGLMFNGNIFGDRTTGITTIAEIVGISIISSSTRKLRGR